MALSSLFPGNHLQPLVGIAKLAAEGQAISEGHDVEYLTLENRSVLTRCRAPRMPFEWMINPYRGCEFACKYCYARYTHEFMELRDSRDFERKIYVKQHTSRVLRQELKKVRPGEQIAIGTATDPYQPAERKFGVTRSIMEELAQYEGLEIGLVTKSTLLLRDLELLQVIACKSRLTVCVTVTTVNAELARALEPRAPRPDLRLLAVQRLNAAGVRAGVNIAPVLPGITDLPADMDSLIAAAANSGAKFVWSNALFLKDCSAKVFLPFVESKFPHLANLYKQRFAKRSFLPASYSDRLRNLVKRLCEKHSLGDGTEKWRAPSAASDPHQLATSAQMSLF
ncbi:MAG TPA: radical SAM protein [Candidatus Angelobacter sp.]|jgi:DNA repair photolyase|nr:radical SAM protein [Candidatus Angelobacter sp.]